VSIVAFGWDRIPAQVTMEMSPWVRVAQWGGHEGKRVAIGVYAQPSFYNKGLNARVEAIKNIQLCVQPVEGGEPLALRAATYGKLVTNKPLEDETERHYEYISDATPLIVSPNEERLPLVKFEPEDQSKDDPWNEAYFEVGEKYRLTLTAEKGVSGGQLRETIVLQEAFTEEDMDKMPPDRRDLKSWEDQVQDPVALLAKQTNQQDDSLISLFSSETENPCQTAHH
jgi:hypothetical protein